MPKQSNLTPHDRYMRSICSYLPVIQECFEKHLPLEILKAIDFSTLKPMKDSFINDKLHQKVADLLFSVKFNEGPGYIYLLMEHASTPDKLLPFRMIQYIFAIMEQHLQQFGGKKLPLVVPMILYTGEKGYPHSTDIFDLFGKEKTLAKAVFRSPYELIDLTQIPDDTLRENYTFFGAAALTAKHIRHLEAILDVVPFHKSVLYLLQKLTKQGFHKYAHTTLSYMFLAGEMKNKEEFAGIIGAGLSRNDEEELMTIAEHYRQKGLKEGEQKGRQEGEQRAALNLFDFGMTPEQVAEAIKLPLIEVQALWSQNKNKDSFKH